MQIYVLNRSALSSNPSWQQVELSSKQPDLISRPFLFLHHGPFTCPTLKVGSSQWR